MTENTVDTVQSSIWNLNNLLNNLTKERLIYFGITLVLVGAIIYYLKYVRKSEQLLNQLPQQPMMNQPTMNQQMMQQPMMQQPMMQQQPMKYPKKIMMDTELVEELKTKNMTPQDYIFELQKTGQFPHGPMPDIVIENNQQQQENQHNIKHKENVKLNKNKDNLKDLKIDEDEEDETTKSLDFVIKSKPKGFDETNDEDDNLKDEDLSKEEMDNIKEHLLKLQKPSNK